VPISTQWIWSGNLELFDGRLADAGLIEVLFRASIPLLVLAAGLLLVLLVVDRLGGSDV